MNPALRPFLTYSGAAHLLLLAAAALGPLNGARKDGPVYHIDFIGPSAIVQSAGPAAPAAAVPAAAPKSDDSFSRRKPGSPLPKPSLLGRERAPAAAVESAPPAAASGAGGAPGSAGIATDMPNFPYPWYISQIRASLWSQWAARMPRQGGEAVVVFSLLPKGEMVDLRIEESSGDSAFDLAALGAAQDAAPFPPLPRGFSEPFLKIHVTLKSQ